MSKRYPGGLITKTPVTPTTSSAPGVWTLEQALQYIKAGTWPGLPDPYFNYVTMLLHGDGTNGAQNNTFLDSSTNNFSITRNGNTTQGSFSPYGSNWSNYFGGVSGNYLAPQSATSSVAFGTGNFTFECWLNADSTSGNNFVLDARSSGTQNNLCFLIQNGSWLWQYAGSGIISTSSGMITVGTWNHIAFVRNSGTLSLYVNGSLITSVSDSTNYAAAAAAGRPGIAGGGFNTTEIFKGYISNLRIVVGTAVYTSAFTPSTTPLTAIANTSLLTCQSNRFIDNSTNAFAITVNGTPSVQRFSPFSPTAAYSTSTIGGSGYFDGSGDWLSVADGSWITLGTNNFTAECWIYNTSSTGASQYICGQGATLASSVSFELYLTSSRTLTGGIYVGSQKYATSTGAIPLNAWTHVALVRDGGNIRIYINGVQDGVNATAGSSSVVDQPYQFSIGRGGEYNGSYFVGNISDYRFINGTCLYPNGTTFTPPTAPLTAVSNTQLLCNMTNGAIFDNAMMNNLETVGNAQISTSVVKFGTGSMAFDGTGDYLVAPSSVNWDFGTGNFTVEFWINFSSLTNNAIVGKWGSGSGKYAWIVQRNGTNLIFYTGNNGTLGTQFTFSWSPSTSTWYHVAITRSGTSLRAFVNGSQIGTTQTTSDSLTASGAFCCIGENLDFGGQSQFINGYVDDLRITKGYARYTANFTPPTAAFSNN